MKTVRVRGNQVPLMSDEWRKAITYRNRLWTVFTKDRSDANYAAYTYQKNICTSLHRRAIKTYFRQRSDEMNQDPRQFWNTYRPFLHLRRGLKSNDIILKEDAEIITDKSRIANIFNDYFVNIANHIEAPSEVACVTDRQNRRYSPSAQRLPKACSDIPLFVYSLLIG